MSEQVSIEKRLEETREAIKDWRAGRAKLGPMPAELWARVVELAGEVGVGVVSRKLTLNHGAVARRLAPSAPASAKRRRAKAHGQFVELSPPRPVAPRSGSTVVELTSPTGERLMLRLSEPINVGALLSQFQARQ